MFRAFEKWDCGFQKLVELKCCLCVELRISNILLIQIYMRTASVSPCAMIKKSGCLVANAMENLILYEQDMLASFHTLAAALTFSKIMGTLSLSKICAKKNFHWL